MFSKKFEGQPKRLFKFKLEGRSKKKVDKWVFVPIIYLLSIFNRSVKSEARII